jgi:hypothetical protein
VSSWIYIAFSLTYTLEFLSQRERGAGEGNKKRLARVWEPFEAC